MSSRRKLDSLPNELKTTIARKCFEADQNYKEMMKEMSSWEELHPDVPNLIVSNAKVHGHSVSTLSLLSKGWREVAAPFVFRELHLNKVLDSIFVLRISRLRSNCFVTAKFDTSFASASPHHVDMAISHLASSFHLTTLCIASDSILRPNVPLNESQRLVLLEACSRIKNVTFQVHRGSEWPSALMIGMFPMLRRLAIVVLAREARSDEGLVQLRQGLGLVPLVRVLELSTVRGVDLSPLYNTPDDSTTVLPPTPQLTSVAISARDVHPSALDFAQTLAKTLETLKLEFTTANGDANTSSFRFQDRHCLDKLRSLSLLGHRPTIEPIFFSAYPQHFPSLSSLCLALDYCEITMEPPELCETEEPWNHGVKFPLLKVFELVDRKWTVNEDTANEFVETVEGNGITARIGKKSEPFDALVLWNKNHNEPLGSAKVGVELVFAFLAGRVESARSSGSKAEWDRLVTLLRAVELERVAMMS